MSPRFFNQNSFAGIFHRTRKKKSRRAISSTSGLIRPEFCCIKKSAHRLKRDLAVKGGKPSMSVQV
ncbi:MAG: hypothetical protein COZ77_04850, partial [Gallionellales bacterium CG_4_8_14_3_um_filter_54_18]